MPEAGSLHPFRLGSIQTYPPADRTFLPGQKIVAAFRISGLIPEAEEPATVEFSLKREDEVLRHWNKSVQGSGEPIDSIEEIDPSGLTPGNYSLWAELIDSGGRKGIQSESFFITSRSSLPEEWSLAERIAPLGDPQHSYIRGCELLNSGKLEEARKLLRDSYLKAPSSLDFALALARVDFLLDDQEAVQALLVRFLEKAGERSDVYELLGRSHFERNEFGRAAYFFKKYLAHFGTNLEILNLLAEALYRIGEIDEALAAWKKSLELAPEQPQVKERIALIEKNKDSGVFLNLSFSGREPSDE
jgi:tetratricopeptide (TPR) repeat protein